MRIRTIKPEFWTDEKVVELSAYARLLFIGLWQIADDEGRLEYSSRRIQLTLFPADAVDVAELTAELVNVGLVSCYTIDGRNFLEVCHFSRHQKVDNRYPSRLPPNPAGSRQSPPDPASGREGNGKGNGGEGEKRVRSREECRADFKRFLARRGLASDETAIEEFIGFAVDYGAAGFDRITHCIHNCVLAAKEEGVKPRYARDLARYGPLWRRDNPPPETKETA